MLTMAATFSTLATLISRVRQRGVDPLHRG